MQKIIILSLVLLSTLGAKAGDKSPIDDLDQIQKFVKSMSTTVNDPLCKDCSKEELFNQCAQEICAKGNIHTNTDQLMDQSIMNALLKVDDPKIGKIYNNLIDLTSDAILSSIKKYSFRLNTTKKLVNGDTFSENKDQIQVLTIYNLLDLWSKSDTKNLSPYLQLQVKRLSPSFAKIVNDNYNFYAHNPDIHYKLMYPELDTKKAMLEDLKKFETLKENILVSDFTKYDPTLKNKIQDFYKSKFYQNLTSGKNVNVSDSSEMLNAMSIYGTQLAVLKDPYINLIKKDLDINEINKAMHSKDMKSKLNGLANQLAQFKPKSKDLNQLSVACANNFLGSYLSLPSKDIDKSLDELAKELKAKMNEKVLSKLSSESKKKLQPALDSWHFETTTNEDYLKDLTDHLKKLTDKNQYDIGLLEKLNSFQNTDLESVKLQILNYSSENGANTDFLLKNVLPDLRTICLVDIPKPGGDKAYTTGGGVIVNWGSLHDLNTGSAVLSHEFGHLLSRDIKETPMLSDKTTEIYVETMECLQKKHKTYQQREEDFADLISAMMEGPEGNNVGCYLPQKFSNDPIIETKEMNHPQNFYRLLQVETVMRGSLPDACNRYMELAPTKADFNSCWGKSGSK